MEFNLGQKLGAFAGMSLRAGYNSAGVSYGLGGNLGILSLNVTSFSENVGLDNASIIEERYVVNFGINVADF